MVWIPGTQPSTPQVDYNRLFRDTLKGELDEETARRTLGKFLMYNIGLCVYNLTGYILEPYQRIMIKGWMQKNFTLCVAGRGFSKSWIFAHFCYLYCLFNPNHHILMTSATFRSSRQVLITINEFSERKRDGIYPGGDLLRETFAKDMVKKQDLYQIVFKNGSSIRAVPLGDSNNLRGLRCTVLGVDEGLLIPQHTIDFVLKPFLMGGTDVTKKQRVRRKEDRQIAAGRMDPGARRQFKSDAKMIILSSASYKWEELYETYKRYRKIIEGDGSEPLKRDELEGGAVSSYLVQQLSYKVGKEELMEPAIIKEIREKLIPENVIKREYEAQFIDESGGYFSAKEMFKCTIPMGKRPCIEIVGEKGAEYVLGIDPDGSSSPAADHFAMCVLKIAQRPKDGRKVGLVVHQYACAGVTMKHHIEYLYYILSRFNIVYIVCDTTQGDNSDFITTCNESEYFKRYKIELNPIAADFTAAFEDTVKQVKQSYNPDSSVKRIVQKQYFTSPIIKAANEYLRACYDQELLYFASHANSVANAVPVMCEQDVMSIHRSHPGFHDSDLEGSGNMNEFITNQDNLIELVKKECALIEVTSSPLGNITFDLPHHMTRNRKNAKRNRKDSYSALWLATWGLKILLEARQLPEQERDDGFAPVMIGRRH